MPGTTNETITLDATITATEGTDLVLPLIDRSKPYTSEYFKTQADNSNYRLKVSNTFKSSNGLRNYVNLTHVIPADGDTPEKVAKVTISIDGPMDINDNIEAMVNGLAAWLSDANLEKLRDGQS